MARKALLRAALLAAALAACGAVTPTGTLELQALAGPICPVESVPPDPACAPRPIAIRVAVMDASGARVTTITTRPDGAVRATLRPGRYRLVGVDPGPPTVAEQDVVIDTAPLRVTISVDTGIR